MKIEIILKNGASMPEVGKAGSAGRDIRCIEDVRIPSGEYVVVETGIYMSLPLGWECQVRPRSGLAFKYGITVLNSPGTVDAYYLDEVKVLLINHGSDDVVLSKGTRIAQLVFSKVDDVELESVTEFTSNNDRGGGFGSSGLI